MSSFPDTPVTPSLAQKRRSFRISTQSLSQDSPSLVSPSSNSYVNGTPNVNGSAPRSRRSSRTSQTSFQQQSQQSPTSFQYSTNTPHSASIPSRRKPIHRLSIGSNISFGQSDSGGGFENLADELEGEWDQDLESYVVDEDQQVDHEGVPSERVSNEGFAQSPNRRHDLRHPGQPSHNLDGTFQNPPPSPTHLQPPSSSTTSPRKHRRQNSRSTVAAGTKASGRRRQKNSSINSYGHRTTESLYDGSDYGPTSDEVSEDEKDVFPSLSLSRRMRDLEDITRLSSHNDALSEDGGPVERLTHSLQDLGSQSNIETGISRLITGYTSMATHRTHKIRELINLAHPVIYTSSNPYNYNHHLHNHNRSNSISGIGGAASIKNRDFEPFELPNDFIDELLTEVDSLASSLPFLVSPKPNPHIPPSSQSAHHHPSSSSSSSLSFTAVSNPLTSVQTVAAQTSDLSHTLRSLTDVLQESRLSSATAARKLKSVREMVADIRTEQELMETGIMLIQAGDWDRRCRERQAAQTCRDVIEGFGRQWGVDIDTHNDSDVGTVADPSASITTATSSSSTAEMTVAVTS